MNKGRVVNIVNPINIMTPAISITTSQFARDFEKNSKLMSRGKVAINVPMIMNTGGKKGIKNPASFIAIASKSHPINTKLNPIVTKEEID
jgi:hypothetical protein